MALSNGHLIRLDLQRPQDLEGKRAGSRESCIFHAMLLTSFSCVFLGNRLRTSLTEHLSLFLSFPRRH